MKRCCAQRSSHSEPGGGAATHDGRGRHDERGAVLILALVYIVVISAMVATLTGWASNDLNNTTKFQSTSEEHYALASAMDTAIETERYAPDPVGSSVTAAELGGAATPLGECWQPANGAAYQVPLSGNIDGYVVAVWCTTQINLASSTTRSMTAYACPVSVSSTNCEQSPSLTAIVQYDDYPTPSGPQLNEQCDEETGQCGYSETLISWSWG
jgi:hypothetical protein